MTSKYEVIDHIKKATKSIKANRIKEVNISELTIEVINFFRIHLPDATFERTVIDYEVKHVTDISNSHRVGIYTVYGRKEIRTQIGSHVEENLGTLSLEDRTTVFELYEECIRYTAETADEAFKSIIEAFLAWGHYWSRAAEMVEKIKPIVEQRRRDQEANAIEARSQDEKDFQAFIETGVLPKWFLLEDNISPEPNTVSMKRLPGDIFNKIVQNPHLLCSKSIDGSMSILVRSIEFDAAPASKHWSATADPYLKIWGSNKDFHSEKPLKTSVINNTLTPTWKDLNLTFASKATLKLERDAEHIVIEVWNDNSFKDTMMASAVIDCSHLAALGLRRIRSRGAAEVTKIDLVVRVDFSYAEALKVLIPPDRFNTRRSIKNRDEPEKREAIISVELGFHSSLIAAAFEKLSQSV